MSAKAKIYAKMNTLPLFKLLEAYDTVTVVVYDDDSIGFKPTLDSSYMGQELELRVKAVRPA